MLLTNLVVALESNVHMQNAENKLEPGTHLILGKWYVNGEHNVIRFYLSVHSFIQVSEFITLVRSPWYKPFGLMMVFLQVYALCCHIRHSSSRVWSWKTNKQNSYISILAFIKYIRKKANWMNLINHVSQPNITYRVVARGWGGDKTKWRSTMIIALSSWMRQEINQINLAVYKIALLK